jgi:HTH-type transcriptional regulator/antitoxin HigA
MLPKGYRVRNPRNVSVIKQKRLRNSAVSTARKRVADGENASYAALIAEYPLRPIRTKAEAQRAYRRIDSLMGLEKQTAEVRDYLDVLVMIVERFELESDVDAPEVSHAEMLAHLIDARGISQSEVAKATGIPRQTLSNVVHGQRSLSKSNITKLSAFFNVSASLWL